MRHLLPHNIILSLTILFSHSRHSINNIALAKSDDIDDIPKEISDLREKVTAAEQKAEELRIRLQSHVEASVNRLLSDKNFHKDNGNGGVTASTQKLELKIDLPADLAALVNNGAALKFHQSFGRKENGELGELEDTKVTISNGNGNGNVNEELKLLGTPSQSQDGNGNGNEGATSSTLSASSSATDTDSDIDTATATLCPLGTYSYTGFEAPPSFECTPCPEGETTMRLGSMSCEEVSKEDILAIFYDLMNGDAWNEHHRRGWKSDDLPACDWEGVSCNDDGEIIGLAFPTIGLKNTPITF